MIALLFCLPVSEVQNEKNATRFRCAALVLALTLTLLPSRSFAEVPDEESPDIGAYEHGYGSSTPVSNPAEVYNAATYGENNTNHLYVSTTGSDDTGDGSEENPFATLYAAMEAAVSGTTVHLAAGVYELDRVVNVPAGVSIEGAVSCRNCAGTATSSMTVLTSHTLTREFTDVLLRLVSELQNGYDKTNGHQHISKLFFDGDRTACSAVLIQNRNNVAMHDCCVIDFTRFGVGWRVEDYMDGGSGEPIPNVPPHSWATGGRFFNNYMKDNSYYGPDDWGSSYGRGSLFCAGLKDFRIYNNTIIEDSRTAPPDSHGARIRGIPVKFWYFNGWMIGCKIHDNTIQKLGSTTGSNDGDGWAFAIESASHAGLEIYNNNLTGAIDLNASMDGTFGGTNYSYATWIHDNRFTADPRTKPDGTNYEEWAIVLERITETTIIERNTVTGYNTFLYFNMRDSVTNTTVRYNVCTDMSAAGGTMIRLDGIDQAGTRSPMLVDNLRIYNNVLSPRAGCGGFPIFLGQEILNRSMNPAANLWRGQNITIANNIIPNAAYGTAVIVGKTAGSVRTLQRIDGLNIENNLIYPQSTGILQLTVAGDNSNGVTVADNILATAAEWSAAFGSGFHPAAGSVLIDAGKNMGTTRDAWNNPVTNGTARPPESSQPESEPESQAPESSQPESEPESQAPESSQPESEQPESQAPESSQSESEPESQAPESSASESEQESQAPESSAPESEPESQAPESSAAESEPESEAPESSAAESEPESEASADESEIGTESEAPESSAPAPENESSAPAPGESVPEEPDGGCESPDWLWIAVLAAAAAILTLVLVRDRRKKKAKTD